MATLNSEDLSFEFNYSNFEGGWISYQFYFRWRGDNIINESILKKRGDYWGNRADGAFLAQEYEADGLTRLLKKVLEKNQADYWESLDPDILVAVYPDQFFPFLPSHYRLVRESDEHKAERAAREKLKKEQGNLPDDLFTIIVSVDAYNLKHTDAYYGSGLSLQMIVSREDLEVFFNNLETEYQAFKEKFRVDGWQENE
ncbi:MAG: hypothetical protein RIR39_1942 [Pseudomonadota bacterium]